MPDPDYKALCAELADRLQHAITSANADSYYGENRNAVDRAHAALSQPEPVAPTDEKLLRMAASAIDPYESSGIAIGEYEPKTQCAVEVYGSELIAYARAVLARWGTPAIQPVPVSERLPGPEDCDAEGCCWAIGGRGNWMCVHVIGRSWSNPIYTHWLPHWALPMPTPANNTRGTH